MADPKEDEKKKSSYRVISETRGPYTGEGEARNPLVRLAEKYLPTPMGKEEADERRRRKSEYDRRDRAGHEFRRAEDWPWDTTRTYPDDAGLYPNERATRKGVRDALRDERSDPRRSLFKGTSFEPEDAHAGHKGPAEMDPRHMRLGHLAWDAPDSPKEEDYVDRWGNKDRGAYLDAVADYWIKLHDIDVAEDK